MTVKTLFRYDTNACTASLLAVFTVLLGILIGVTIIIFGFLYGKRMIGMQGADEETVQIALDYFYIMTGGSIFMPNADT